MTDWIVTKSTPPAPASGSALVAEGPGPTISSTMDASESAVVTAATDHAAIVSLRLPAGALAVLAAAFMSRLSRVQEGSG